MRKCFLPSLVALLALIPIDSFAHHGKEYLLISTYKTPPQGSLFAVLSSDYIRVGRQPRELEFEPGLFYGMTNSWSIELHSHGALVAGHFDTESIGLETRFRMFGPGEVHDEAASMHEISSPFSLAVLLEYEKGFKGSHDAFEGRLIAGRDFRPVSLVANFILQKDFEEGKKFKFQYGLGIKHSFDDLLGAGIEIESGNQHENGIRLTPGIYTTLSNGLDVRIGASFRSGAAGSDELSFHSAVVYAF